VAVRGGIDCQTANGKRPVAGVRMHLMEWDVTDPNDILSETTTNNAGVYSLEGEEDEFSLGPQFYADVWFPYAGPILDQCKNAAYHAQCDALKPTRRNCHHVIKMLNVPKDKHYKEDQDKKIHDAGRFLMDTDAISRSYMKCD
ncbi:hypothetical protein PENTCL1PPCAC_29446, partial [Pristionchus entomophagus]